MSKHDQTWLLFVAVYFVLAVPGFALFRRLMFAGLRRGVVSEQERADVAQSERTTSKWFFWTMHGGALACFVAFWLVGKTGWLRFWFASHPALQAVGGILLGLLAAKVMVRVFPLRGATLPQHNSHRKDNV